MGKPKKSSKIPGPAIGYTDLIDTAISSEELAIESRDYSPLRPSSAGKCTRQLAYEMAEYEGRAEYAGEIKAPNVVRLLSLGHSVEYSALQFFAKLKKEFGIEVKYKQQVVEVFTLDDGTLIEGSCDLALVGPDGKGVADVKSFKDRFSKAYQTGLDETMAKYDNLRSLTKISETSWYAEDAAELIREIGEEDYLTDNILQLNLYLMSDFFQSRGFDHGVIYKYGKNDSRHYELRFKPSPELKEMVRQKFNEVRMTKDPNDVTQTFFLGTMRCSFCPYAERCWGDNDPKKAFFKTLPKKSWPTDIDKIPQSRQVIGDLFQEFIEMETQTEAKGKVEARLARLLFDQKISKIRLESGDIFELKLLKSPREHFEIRRSKI